MPAAISDTMLAQARDYIERGYTVPNVAKLLHISENTIRQRVLGGAPAGKSARNQILEALAQYDRPVETSDLMQGTAPTDIHNVVHLVWALQKQGLVTFKERPANGHATPSGITITARGRRQLAKAYQLGGRPQPAPVPGPASTPDSAPVADAPATVEQVGTAPAAAASWPHLQRLRERGARLAAAAAALEGLEGADDLVLALYELAPGDVEAEYLRFADACGQP